MLRQLHAARSSQNIEVIGIAVDFRENVLAYIKEVAIDYPLLIGEQDGLDAAAAFGLGSTGFPFTVFTDNRGRIVAAHLGEMHRNEADLILDTVTAVKCPENVEVGQLRNLMEGDCNVVVAGGQGKLSGKIFRIGHLGLVDEEDIRQTLESLEQALGKLGYVRTGVRS